MLHIKRSNLSNSSENAFTIIHVNHMINNNQNYSCPSDIV